MSPRRLTYTAWGAFALSGVFFVISALRAGDPWSLVGSIVWIIGVGLFVLAMVRT